MFSVWYIIPACMLLPYIGFSLGYVLARLCGQPFKQAATIALETGIQVIYNCSYISSVCN